MNETSPLWFLSFQRNSSGSVFHTLSRATFRSSDYKITWDYLRYHSPKCDIASDKKYMTSGVYERESLEKRFWKKVKKGKDNECWSWNGCIIHGYGRIQEKNKIFVASRISYKLHKGDIPKGMFVCHSCDNPSCVNPKHLWLGTSEDNMQDMVKKNRNRNQFTK